MLTSEEQLLSLRTQLHTIFTACLAALRDENRFRVIHALEVRLCCHFFLKRCVDVRGAVAPLVEEEVAKLLRGTSTC